MRTASKFRHFQQVHRASNRFLIYFRFFFFNWAPLPKTGAATAASNLQKRTHPGPQLVTKKQKTNKNNTNNWTRNKNSVSKPTTCKQLFSVGAVSAFGALYRRWPIARRGRLGLRRAGQWRREAGPRAAIKIMETADYENTNMVGSANYLCNVA